MTTRKTKKIYNTDRIQTFKTFTVLLVYTVMSGKVMAMIEKRKDLLSFEKWIVCYGQPDLGGVRTIF
jgi:hypothetical protein